MWNVPARTFAQRRALTRDRLIAAASKTVIEKGFDASSLDEVAARAGLIRRVRQLLRQGRLIAAVVKAWPNGSMRSLAQGVRWHVARADGATGSCVRRISGPRDRVDPAELTAYVYIVRPCGHFLPASADWMRRTEAGRDVLPKSWRYRWRTSPSRWKH
jgi:hypothetical protein